MIGHSGQHFTTRDVVKTTQNGINENQISAYGIG